MIDISKRSKLKYLLFADLYLAEGLEMVLIGFIVPMYFLDIGYSISTITLVSGIASTPWIIKFIWGGIVDYFIKFGRKKFIIMGTILAVICLFILSFIDPLVALIPFSILLLLSHVGVIFLDVSADAWAIEISKKKERGKINGSMVAGMTIGMSVGGTLFALISKNIGFTYAFITAGFIILLLAVFPYFVKEVKKIKKTENIAPIVINEFKKKMTLLIVFLGVVLSIGYGLRLYVFPLFQKTILNMDIVHISLLGNLGIIWSVSGAVIGGYLSDRWGRKKTLYIFIIIIMIFSSSLIFIKRWEQLFLYIPVAFSMSGITATFLAMAMDITNPRVGATQFSIITSISNIGEWFGSTISGTLVLMLGFSRVFLYSALIMGPALMILYFIRLKTISKKINPTKQ